MTSAVLLIQALGGGWIAPPCRRALNAAAGWPAIQAMLPYGRTVTYNQNQHFAP